LLYGIGMQNEMRSIGLIGGITWESTLDYYRVINREVARRLGGVHSARLVMVSLDFDAVRSRTLAGDEAGVLEIFVEAAHALERAGAELLVLCANTAHAAPSARAAPCSQCTSACGGCRTAAHRGERGLLGTAA
jgi:aspartate racemase